MTGNYDDYDRPFEVKQNPHLSNLTDLPKFKEPDYFGEADRETEDPYPSTDFNYPDYSDKGDWW